MDVIHHVVYPCITFFEFIISANLSKIVKMRAKRRHPVLAIQKANRCKMWGAAWSMQQPTRPDCWDAATTESEKNQMGGLLAAIGGGGPKPYQEFIHEF